MILLPLAAAAALISPAALPAAPAAPARASSLPAAGENTYTVRPGDTMTDIAGARGVTLGSLLRANGMNMNSPIRPGQKIVIPRSSAPAGAARITGTAGSLSPAARTYAAEKARTAEEKAACTGRHRTRDLIVATARRYGIDPDLALAVAWQESRWNQQSVSRKNAIGVMQCLPGTGTWMSRKVGRTLDLNDTQDNITCGVALLKTLKRSASSEREAIAGYYQGLSSVRSDGMYRDTARYVESVLHHRNRM